MAKLEQIRFINKEWEHRHGFSAVVNNNGTLYLSGILPLDGDEKPVAAGDFEGQMNYVYNQLAFVLHRLHVGFDSVLQETIFVTDINQFKKNNPARVKRYPQGCAPAASVVQVGELLYPGCMIELQVIAEAANYTGI